jgi:alkylation response protein AidB-like acyl-CoA dehydrogenase
MFLLVRTDDQSKHNGITFILIDMTTPGVEVKPIRLISGNSPFCETFLSDVKGELENVVGGVNNGWTVAKTLLNFARAGLGTGGRGGGPRRGAATGGKLVQVAKEAAGERDGKIEVSRPPEYPSTTFMAGSSRRTNGGGWRGARRPREAQAPEKQQKNKNTV